MNEYNTIQWIDGVVRMLDQRLLPHQEVYQIYSDYREVAAAIRDMVIRGAPAIGAAAGFGLALVAVQSSASSTTDFLEDLYEAVGVLSASRPTAVNLRWALNRIIRRIEEHRDQDHQALRKIVIETAHLIANEDVNTNRQIGKNGAVLLPDGANVIHHCNTGALATVGYGTALGVIRFAHESGKSVHVYVDETRPRLQGARLTSWELKKLNIPHTVIVDGASAHLMRTRRIDLCLVGCDRIASNGDVANKIGTYNLALAAFCHHIPFYVAGPTSTFDMKIPSGDVIEIENRPTEEVACIGETKITPLGVMIENPAFDITPAEYVTGIITENGIVYPPYPETFQKLTGTLE